jgi:hypothetical protein
MYTVFLLEGLNNKARHCWKDNIKISEEEGIQVLTEFQWFTVE